MEDIKGIREKRSTEGAMSLISMDGVEGRKKTNMGEPHCARQIEYANETASLKTENGLRTG